ncbi:MAG: hypothetical protein ACRECH_02885 [Nitrososphaerales archaeon]
MRIKTSRTLRSIDQWKHRLRLRNHKFMGGMSVLLLGFSAARKEVGMLLLLVLGLSVHFAAVQFASLVLVGFFIAKLNFYRFANLFLRFSRLS